MTTAAPMLSRERTARAIERRRPDRIPVHYAVLPGARRVHGQFLDELRAEYPPDIVVFGYSESEEFSGRPNVMAVDRWGAGWVTTSAETKGQVVDHPLADWRALAGYEWPSPAGWPEYAQATRFIEKDAGRRYVLADGDTLFQRMMYLRGVEELMVDLAVGRPEVAVLRDGIVDYMLGRIREWCEAGVHGIYFRDDWGSQQALLIRPTTWRRVFKAAYARLFEAVHAYGRHVFFHSDGMIADIVDDLVEIGADVIHPQMTLLGAAWLANRYGGRVSFQADPDRQWVLPRGTRRDVEAHVVCLADALAGFEGGLIGWGEIGPDVPLENARAMIRAFATWRPKPVCGAE